MRSPVRARWAFCALALCLLAPAATADPDAEAPKKKDRPSKKSIAACTSFDQRDRADEDGVDFVFASSCETKLACGVKWTLTCAPGTKSAKKTKEAVAFSLDTGTGEEVTASAAACGYHGWEIAQITWSCQPTE